MTVVHWLGNLIGSVLFFFHCRILSLAVSLVGGIRAAQANYEIDEQRIRIMNEDLAIAFVKRSLRIDLKGLKTPYGIKFYMYTHWASLLGGNGIALLKKCGWSDERIGNKFERLALAEAEAIRVAIK